MVVGYYYIHHLDTLPVLNILPLCHHAGQQEVWNTVLTLVSREVIQNI